MSRLVYRLGTGFGQFIFWQCMRLKVIRPQAARRQGPYILACTHLSHLDPFMMSIVMARQQIDWLARIEFWKFRATGKLMEWMDAIPVRRFGVAANSIRTGVERLKQGRIVGVCPEGGCAQGPRSVMRVGPMKRGACIMAYRANVPILPCIMLGTDKLNCVSPWLPFRRARLWVSFSPRVIVPDVSNPDPKSACDDMMEQLRSEYRSLFVEAKQQFGLTDVDVP